MIDANAIIHPSAKIAENVTIGPWTLIGKDVEIAEGSWIGPHVVINGPCKIGKNNKIFQFASIGDAPQDLTYAGEDTLLEIGDNNTIREYCMINRGSKKGGGVTRIGNHNFIMGYVHIGHDCHIGDHCIFVNYCGLAGHVVVHDYAIIGGYAAVHQFCTIGHHAFVAKATYVTQDVLPFIIVDGNSPLARGINTVGLKRRGFSPETIQGLKRAYKIIFRNSLMTKQAIDTLNPLVAEFPEIKFFIDALKHAKRGIVR
jgi:UDP-N-acetylglucosamine acyltransferase